MSPPRGEEKERKETAAMIHQIRGERVDAVPRTAKLRSSTAWVLRCSREARVANTGEGP